MLSSSTASGAQKYSLQAADVTAAQALFKIEQLELASFAKLSFKKEFLWPFVRQAKESGYKDFDSFLADKLHYLIDTFIDFAEQDGITLYNRHCDLSRFLLGKKMFLPALRWAWKHIRTTAQCRRGGLHGSATKAERAKPKQRQAHELREQGWTHKRIAEEIGVCTKTIQRWLKMAPPAVVKVIKNPPSYIKTAPKALSTQVDIRREVGSLYKSTIATTESSTNRDITSTNTTPYGECPPPPALKVYNRPKLTPKRLQEALAPMMENTFTSKEILGDASP